MLEVAKFKLIDGGRGGIIIEGREAVQLSNTYQVIDEIKRTRKLVLSEDVIGKVQRLKYFFLNCTGHWMSPFNKYYDILENKALPINPGLDGKIKDGQELLRNLLNKTVITGISYSSGGFVITGSIETVLGKKVVINTPFITEEDDLGFYSSAVECIGDCIHTIVNTFSSNVLPQIDPKTILSEEEMKGLNMSELTNLVVEKLVDRNMIMLIKEDGPEVLSENTDKKTKISTSTGSIDSHNIPETEEYKSELEPPIEEEQESSADRVVRENLNANTRNAFGNPASDSEMPEEFQAKDKVSGRDLESLEHSENMGLGGEEQTKIEAEQWEE